MSTSEAPNPTPTAPDAALAALRTSAFGLFIGLTWGALMLLVFGQWMRSKYAGVNAPVTTIFFVASAAAAAAAAWQMFTLWFKQESAPQKIATLSQQRQIFSLVNMGAGLGLIVLAFVLGADKSRPGFSFTLNNFPETIGALLFGLIALGSGYVLQIAPSDQVANPVRFLVGQVPVLKACMIVIGVAALGSFVFLVFKQKIGWDFLPELTALLFLSVVSAACMFWLNSGQMDEDGVRLFVLVFGGAAGLILFFVALGRAFVWRNSIFGIAAWQGDSAWRFWLCAYLLFTSLMLMFISFSLARADIRANVNLRRLMYGYDAIAQTFLLLGILFEMNVVIYAMVPFTYDWTKSRGTYALAESTKRLVGGLKKETNLVVLLPQNHEAYRDLRIMLDNCQALSNNLKVRYINPDSEFREYENLADKFRKILPDIKSGQPGRGVLVVSGPIPEKEDPAVLYEFVHERRLTDIQRGMRPDEKTKILYKGEAEIMKELKFLLDGRTKRKLYVLQGDDEPSMANSEFARRRSMNDSLSDHGLGMFIDKLQKENFDVSGLTFQTELPAKKTPTLVAAKESAATKRKEVPDDCHTLIIAGVTKPVPSDTIDAIRAHVDRGGKLLVCLDLVANKDFSKLVDTGIEGMLSRFGVEVSNEYPLRLLRRANDDTTGVFAKSASDSTNPLATAFTRDTLILERGTRIVQPDAKGGGRFKAETVLQLPWQTGIVLEKDASILKNPHAHMLDYFKDPAKAERAITQKPVSVAVAVKDTNGDKPCIVVIGDTEFLTNLWFVRYSEESDMPYNFVVSSLEWMAEREAIGAPPKVTSTYKRPDSAKEIADRMVMLPFTSMALMIIGLGICIWVVRRR